MVARVSILRRLLVATAAAALAGSIWAVLREEWCGPCSRSGALVGGLNLGVIGTVFYSLVLVTTLLGRRRRNSAVLSAGEAGAAGAMLVAGGVHFPLLALLFRHGILCPPCVVTGACALIGMLTAFALLPAHRVRAVGLVSLMAIGSYAGSRVLRDRSPRDHLRQAMRAERILVREEVALPLGCARMVVFQRSTCPVCRRFKAQVVPPLRQQFGSRLTIEEREPWPGMGIPTIIVLGRRNTRLVGYQSVEQVDRAVRLACGDSPVDPKRVTTEAGEAVSLVASQAPPRTPATVSSGRPRAVPSPPTPAPVRHSTRS
jgi:uncharacterized membrane protein